MICKLNFLLLQAQSPYKHLITLQYCSGKNEVVNFKIFLLCIFDQGTGAWHAVCQLKSTCSAFKQVFTSLFVTNGKNLKKQKIKKKYLAGNPAAAAAEGSSYVFECDRVATRLLLAIAY